MQRKYYNYLGCSSIELRISLVLLAQLLAFYTIILQENFVVHIVYDNYKDLFEREINVNTKITDIILNTIGINGQYQLQIYFGVCITVLVTAAWVGTTHCIKFLYFQRKILVSSTSLKLLNNSNENNTPNMVSNLDI